MYTVAMTNYSFVKLHSKRLIEKYYLITIPVIKMYNEIVILFYGKSQSISLYEGE